MTAFGHWRMTAGMADIRRKADVSADQREWQFTAFHVFEAAVPDRPTYLP
jgi:hypothetical protein